MKTAARENPTHRAIVPNNRASGAVGQNRSRSISWAAKQENFRPRAEFFFLTSPFIEPTGSNPFHPSRRPLAAILPLFLRRVQLPIPLGLNLLLMPGEHVLWSDVADGTVQAN